MKSINLFQSVLPFKENLEISRIATENPFTESKDQKEPDEPRLKCRHIVVSVGFLLYFLINAYRMNMSVGIVAMVNISAVPRETRERSDSCPDLVPNVSAHEAVSLKKLGEDGEFDWSPEIQGYVLGSYFFGYVIALIPTGGLVERFGCKWFLFWGSFITGVSTFLIPYISWTSVVGLIVLQTLRGLAQGFIQPASSVLTANWFPIPERGLLFTIMTSGGGLGSFFGSLLSGFLCASLGRWPSVFYTFGTIGLVASVLIAVFVHESPKDHPKISRAELHYILNNQECALSQRRPKLPWRKILTSVPVYALMYGAFGQIWAVSQFLIVHSTFLGTILHYPIEKNGFFTAVPFLLQFTMAQIAAFMSSYVIRKNIVSLNRTRKFCNFMSCLGFSASMMGVYFAGCDRNSSIIFSMLATGFTGFGFAGCWITAIDMTPTFAGSLNGMTLAFACLSGVFFPLVVGYLTDGMQTIEQWNKVFFISIGIVLSSGFVFSIFGSAEVQPWNYVDEDSEKQNSVAEKDRFLN